MEGQHYRLGAMARAPLIALRALHGPQSIVALSHREEFGFTRVGADAAIDIIRDRRPREVIVLVDGALGVKACDDGRVEPVCEREDFRTGIARLGFYKAVTSNGRGISADNDPDMPKVDTTASSFDPHCRIVLF